jgi:DNA-binding NarL/FixJ family response regulator
VRELEVLKHVVQGQMNKQIAAMLGIHERTVKLHRHAITTKLGVHGVAELTTLTRATRYHRRAVVKDVAVTITCSTENRVVENRP